MIRVKCPKCEKRMAVDDARAGGVGTCPDCGQKFRIPVLKAEADDRGRPTKAAAKKGPAPQAKGPAKPANPAPSRPKEDWEEEDSSPYPVAEQEEQTEQAKRVAADSFKDKEYERLRRKKELELEKEDRQKQIAFVAIMVFVWLGMGVYAYFQPEYAFVPYFLGGLMSLVGGIWLVVVAFKEDGALAGVLVLFVPFYHLYYAIKNFAIANRPLLIMYVGWLISGTCLGVAGGQAKMIESVKKLMPETSISVPARVLVLGSPGPDTAAW